jgi:hypothetical protein
MAGALFTAFPTGGGSFVIFLCAALIPFLFLALYGLRRYFKNRSDE